MDRHLSVRASARINSANYEAQLSKRGSFVAEHLLMKARAKACANPPRSMSAPLISGAIRRKLRRICMYRGACRCLSENRLENSLQVNGAVTKAPTFAMCADKRYYANACGPPRFLRDAPRYRAWTRFLFLTLSFDS